MTQIKGWDPRLPSAQEMFDRAVRGLRAQGFRRSAIGDDRGAVCHYELRDPQGTVLRCAWGHVDPSIHGDVKGSVDTLRGNAIGLATLLRVDDGSLEFARALQAAHDDHPDPSVMEAAFRDLGRQGWLSWPE